MKKTERAVKMESDHVLPDSGERIWPLFEETDTGNVQVPRPAEMNNHLINNCSGGHMQ